MSRSTVRQASLPPVAPRPPEVVPWRAAWSGAAGLSAVAILLVQLVWRTSYLAQGYFTQDDFLMLHLGGTSPLDLRYLFQDYSGHLWPGAFLISFVEARLWPLSWPAAYLPIAAMELAAGALAWMLLTRLLGRRWHRLPLLAVFCFSPLTLWATQWWAVAITLLPMELCALGAAMCYLESLRSDSVRWRWFVVGLAGAGLLFQERGVLIPVVVAAVALITDPAPRIWARAVATYRRHAAMWLALVALEAGYLLLHTRLAPVQGGSGTSGSSGLVSNFFFRNVTPGILGGPWTGQVLPGVAVVPPDWVVVVSVLVLAAVVVVTLRFDGTTTRVAWLVLLVYASLDVALLFGGRAQYGSAFGLLPRYAADMMPIVVIALAGAIRDVRLPERVGAFFASGRRGDRTIVACVAVTLVYTGSAAITTHLMAPDLYNRAARTYVENLHHDLQQQPSVVLYDGRVPDDVMISWFGSRDLVSTVYGLAADAPPFDLPSEQMRVVDGSGHLQPVTFGPDAVSAVPGPSSACGYNVNLDEVLIPMQSPVPDAKNVLRLGYYTNVDDVGVVQVGDQQLRFPVYPGLHDVDLVVSGGFSSFTVRLTRTTGTLCLAAATAGVPQDSAS